MQDETPPNRYITAEGPVVEIDRAPTGEEALRITSRYLPADEAARWVEENLRANSLLVRMCPEEWLSADYGKA